jgi:hypothetical protein
VSVKSNVEGGTAIGCCAGEGVSLIAGCVELRGRGEDKKWNVRS